MKIGKDTLIFNMCSAHDCPSKKRGLCQLPDTKYCYAFGAEVRYKTVLEYRRRQEQAWDSLSATDIADEIKGIIKRSRKTVTYCRWNESGDFRNVKDIIKLYSIAKQVPSLKFYGYTARKDLLNRKTVTSKLPSNVVINGSGFMWHNEFKACDTITSKYSCKGDCRKCNLCKNNSGIVIEESIRR